MTAFFIHIPLIAFLCWQFYRRSIHQPLIAFYWWGLLGKFLAGVSIGLLYMYYYPYQGDTFSYFNDAATLSTFAYNDPLAYVKILLFNEITSESLTSSLELWNQPRAFFMAKLVSVLCLFTWNNYWLCSLYLSLLSFSGLWTLANTLVILFPSSQKAAGISFLLFPSVLMWSSGLTKESLVMACIAGFIHICLSWKFGLHTYVSSISKTGVCLLVLIYIVLLWKLKYYYLAALLPSAIAYFITDALLAPFKRLSNFIRVGVLTSVFAAILIAATFLHPNLHINNFLQALFVNHAITVSASAANSIVEFENLQPTMRSITQHLPEALFSGLFRPLIWEGNSLFQYYVGTENLLLLIATVYTLLTKRNWLNVEKQTQFLLISVTILYIFLLAGLLALSSPNFGALSRYKIAFLPFLVYLLIWAVFKHKQAITNR